MSRSVRVTLVKNGAVISEKCEAAETFMPRFLGLMGRAGLADGAGVYFPRCKSIHMMFLRFAIDVVFLGGGQVSSVHRGVRPWRLFPLTDWKADAVLELPEGTVERCGIDPGDEVCIS